MQTKGRTRRRCMGWPGERTRGWCIVRCRSVRRRSGGPGLQSHGCCSRLLEGQRGARRSGCQGDDRTRCRSVGAPDGSEPVSLSQGKSLPLLAYKHLLLCIGHARRQEWPLLPAEHVVSSLPLVIGPFSHGERLPLLAQGPLPLCVAQARRQEWPLLVAKRMVRTRLLGRRRGSRRSWRWPFARHRADGSTRRQRHVGELRYRLRGSWCRRDGCRGCQSAGPYSTGALCEPMRTRLFRRERKRWQPP